MSDELNRLLRESFEYNMANVHTCFPGVVVKYDAATRRADIQPSLKRKMPDGKFMDFPVIPDIPVEYPGTKNCTIHFPLEEGTEVSVHVIERSTDVWRDRGGDGIEDTDPRRFNLQDCYATPGLQPKDFPKTPATGISIIYKEKQKILIDDGKVTITNGGDKVVLDNGKVDVNASSKVTITAAQVEITGGQFSMKGTVPPGSGPLCAIPNCMFTGAPHGGNQVSGT